MATYPIPAEFEEVLKAAKLWEFFLDCTPSHQREYLRWIGEAKKSETRTARSEQAVKRLAAKQAEEIRKSKKSASA